MRRALRQLLTAVVCAAASGSGGCSTFVDLAGVPHTGLQPDGRYIVSSEEKALGCRQLTSLVQRQVKDMQAMPDRVAAERDAIPKTVLSAVTRTFGEPGSGLKTLTDYQRARARAVALNGALADKSCVTVDLDAPLADSDHIMTAVGGRSL